MINLLPRKEFVLTIGGKEYSGKFGTYAMKLFCTKKGIKLSEIETVFPQGALFEDIIDSIIEMILCAIEYKCIADKKPFDLRPVDLYVAIDNGEFKDGELMEAINHAGDESKNVKLETPPTGMTSSEISIQPEEDLTNSGQ